MTGGAVFAALLLVPSVAAADVRSGSITDPTGDVAVPELDITAAEFGYDTQGVMTAKVTFAAAPDATSRKLGVRVGPSSGGPECAGQNVGALVDVPGGTGEAFTGQQTIAAPKTTVQGNVVSVEVRDPAIADQAWDCGFGLTLDEAGDAQDATAQVPLAATAPGPPQQTPAPKPACRIAAASIRRGRSFVVRCEGVSGTVSIRFSRQGKRARTVSARVNTKGTARISTRKLRRGRYRVTVSHKGQRLGTQTVRVR